MLNILKKSLIAFFVFSPLALCLAQSNYPSKPIRWLVPYPAGGGSDFLARTISQELSVLTSQSVLIDNKPGGNTAIAAAETAHAAPDGYTVLSADNGTMVNNPALYKNLSYDPVKELAPITLMGKFPMILIVGPGFEVKTVAEFVAKVKSTPGGLNYGSAGAGSPHHLAMELMKVETGLSMTHVPYKGASPALQDIAGGHIPAMMVDLAAGAGFIKSGKVKALAVANSSRLAQLPDVPTFAELGYKNIEAAAYVGLVAPVATPPEVISSLQKYISNVINQPAVNKKLTDFGIEPIGNTPQQYQSLLRTETTKWQKLIKDLNISLD